jgi:uncharacterized protein YndB with AHSA1/START domain
MTARSVTHDTFTIERTYPAAPSRVFAAFASAEAKAIWGDTGDVESPEGDAGDVESPEGDAGDVESPEGDAGDVESPEGDASAEEFDFRVGGRERFGFRWSGTTYRYDALYYDIVPDQRIVYSYEMYANDARISVSVTTVEIAKSGDGTALTYTEQGAYLDDLDQPRLRQEGLTEMLDGLAKYLRPPDGR